MSLFWSDRVHHLSPYIPGEQPVECELIKLNTNEHPLPPSPAVLSAIQTAVDSRLRLYPDPHATELRQVLADTVGLQPQQVFLGNGSDEVLAHTFHGLLQQSHPILMPDISYSFYPVFCGLYGIDFTQVPLQQDFTISVTDYDQPNGGIIIPNPNAPTGCLLSLDQIELLLHHNPRRVVVIDEAYIDFGGQSAVSLIPKYDNLLVIQTLSKSRSLAGLRVGYAFGHAALIEALERVKNSFNSYPLSRVAQAGAIAAIADQDYFNQACATVIKQREKLGQQLTSLGFLMTPSQANFIFTTHPQWAAPHLALQLRKAGIIVRHFEIPRIDQYLRISIGTECECKALVQAFRQIIQCHQ
jgi:histidinol-phosphate aminotransferase